MVGTMVSILLIIVVAFAIQLSFIQHLPIVTLILPSILNMTIVHQALVIGWEMVTNGGLVYVVRFLRIHSVTLVERYMVTPPVHTLMQD
jgi:hypothetical protein